MVASEVAINLAVAVVGALVAAALSVVPGLHIYNVAALALLLGSARQELPQDALAFLFLGLTVGYAVMNTIPSVFLAVPDESTAFIILPGQRLLLDGRGYEAAVLTGLGSLGGIVVLALLMPAAPWLLPRLQSIIHPHLPWILWGVIAWMLLSEWPKGSGRAPAGFRRWWDGWRNLLAGLATFVLSGLLGFVLLYRSPVAVTASYQNLLPAFVGLFGLPRVLQNALSRSEVPKQHIGSTVDATPWLLAQGALTGILGGLFAAFFPVVTGGIGGLIAGHATAQRDDRLFLISQGACKAVYYAGGLLLLFVPGSHLVRGGVAAMLNSVWSPESPTTYQLALAAVLLAGTVSFLLLLPLARWVARAVGGKRYRWVSLGALGTLLVIVGAVTGWEGLAVCAVATGIGFIPSLWGARSLNCMGLLLLPIGLEMVGAGSVVAGWMGLIR